ncbi:DUF1630-domain-containing protein [Aulographum hederae CBS 113979]|uniref:DUF1630-domain-containing protein n=1 Tax=Aulographum hederae CBS 113979 TaxID=1176131 RepID=A0A6G1GUG1_9PEZI|nr:DUF1630-domain-containing protein [Aulographum hederae CBS 113979]
MEKLKQLALRPKRRSELTAAGLRHWVLAFVVCNFNVDLGPEIELVYPPSIEFSQSDLLAMCFSSFPERHDTEIVDDISFQYSIRNNSPDVRLDSPHAPYGSASDLYGHCVFRQEYDRRTKRSFNQKSLVLISNHDFPALYLAILQKMTASGLISDPSALEAACAEIASWPAPSIGRLELPFLGSVFVLEIAPHAAFPMQGLPTPLAMQQATRLALYAYQPVGIWSKLIPCMPSLSELYVLFEKLLICESVIVLARSPQLCSEFVSAMKDLIRPVPYAGIVRPYVVMQSDFISMGIDGGMPRPIIVGITNPFLLQRILGSMDKSGRPKPHVISLNDSGEPLDTVPLKPQRSQRHNKTLGAAEASGPGKKYLKSDHSFMKEISNMMKSEASSEMVGSVVRRHFAELSAQFLSPVHRYLATSMSSTSVLSPGGNVQYGNFSEAEFLKSLGKFGTSVNFRGQNPIQRHRARDGLYEQFCRSPNFYSWLEMKLSLEKEASAGLLSQSPTKPG